MGGTVSTNPAATLHALADYLVGWGDELGGTDDRYAERDKATLRALAEHVETCIALFGPDFTHPCGVPIARTLLAVAVAAGITP
jgi:hypothetical protein